MDLLKLKLEPDIRLNFYDLMTGVDLESEITIRSIFSHIWNSEIPVELWCQILQCNDLQSFWDELNSKPFDDKGDVEYLELTWGADIGPKIKGKMTYTSGWQFHGVGYPDVVPEDFKKQNIEVDPGYRQGYAIEMTPLYELADYSIRISDKIYLTDYRKKDLDDTEIELQPSISILELFYEVIWELSFHGDVDNRNEQSEELLQVIKKYEEARDNGELKIVEAKNFNELVGKLQDGDEEE